MTRYPLPNTDVSRRKRDEGTIDGKDPGHPFTRRMVGRHRVRAWEHATALALTWEHTTALAPNSRFRNSDGNTNTGVRRGYRLQ